jgi:DNA invertase Pin-like site-specific DNA recombinase
MDLNKQIELLKQPLEKTTQAVNRLLLSGMTKKELSEELDISRPTLDSRLNNRSKWKKLEQKWISKLSKDI